MSIEQGWNMNKVSISIDFIKHLLDTLENKPKYPGVYFDGFRDAYVCCNCGAVEVDGVYSHTSECTVHAAIAHTEIQTNAAKALRAAIEQAEGQDIIEQECNCYRQRSCKIDKR
jgi:hypothetical protein